MLRMRCGLPFWIAVIATILLVAPAWAAPISRDVVVMNYQSALGGTIHVSADGGTSFENVYAGPYQFNIYQAAVTGGNVVQTGNPIATLVAMFCDSASYNLMTSYPYVELSGADVLSGFGRLYAHAPAATAENTYQHMSWALQYTPPL